MPVSEIERMELVGRLSETIGKEAAETLMACTLPEGRDQLATKADIEVLRADQLAMKADIEVLRADQLAMKADIEVLRADQLATKADIEVLKAGLEALASEFRAANVELRSFVEMKLARQARLHYGTLAAFLMSVWAIFLAQNFVM
ncbi:MAG: hypothetical protein OXG67_02115 [bacterium]|nr:hypothetical protein [bacterium]